eukprot:TRINITY_DN8685_c0_g1_i4.p1 TRINITY_DN8685_c0_g1~~TRINITY_DN8685_c0_g1_i4.p1  ORF type:complete len:137 (+),score=33.56 TRINITY_DN8685_c0_g1_i4:811-1221(+)
MAPTIFVKEDGKNFLAFGTPGGPSIPGIMVNMMLNFFFRKMTLSSAIYDPRFVSQNNGTWLFEYGFWEENPTLPEHFHLMGVEPSLFAGDPTGAIAAIHVLPEAQLAAVADLRKGYATAIVSAGSAYPVAAFQMRS